MDTLLTKQFRVMSYPAIIALIKKILYSCYMKKILLVLSAVLLSSVLIPSFLSPSITVEAKNSCGGVETSIISCDNNGGDTKHVENTAVWQLLKIAINVLTSGVVIAALGGLIYASILYTSSGANPEIRKKSIDIITNIAIGIIAFALMWAVLNFILPGGIGL